MNFESNIESNIVDMDTMRILSRSKDLTNRFLSKKNGGVSFWTHQKYLMLQVLRSYFMIFSSFFIF